MADEELSSRLSRVVLESKNEGVALAKEILKLGWSRYTASKQLAVNVLGKYGDEHCLTLLYGEFTYIDCHFSQTDLGLGMLTQAKRELLDAIENLKYRFVET